MSRTAPTIALILFCACSLNRDPVAVGEVRGEGNVGAATGGAQSGQGSGGLAGDGDGSGGLPAGGIEVSVICPGYIRSPLTKNNTFPMPFLMDADRAAKIIRRGLARDAARIAFPFPMYALVWFLAALPAFVPDRLARIAPVQA